MSVYKIELPDTFTINVPGTIGGGTVTFDTPTVLKVAADCFRTGLQQKYSDKVADKKAQAIYNVPGGPDKLLSEFLSRFAAGVWNEKSGGGPRLDPLEKFLRDRALLAAKDKMKEAGLALDDTDKVASVQKMVLANENWVIQTKAEYVAPKATITLEELGLA